MEAVGELLPPDRGEVAEAVAEGVAVEAGESGVVPLVDGDHPLVDGQRQALVDRQRHALHVLRGEPLQRLVADAAEPAFRPPASTLVSLGETPKTFATFRQ